MRISRKAAAEAFLTLGGACFGVGVIAMGALSAVKSEMGRLRREARNNEAQMREAMQQEREADKRTAEAWKEKTQRDLYQAIADQQARGLLNFHDDEPKRHLRAVRPLRDDKGEQAG